MKTKFKFTCETQEIETCSHLEFTAYILIDDNIVNFECVSLSNNNDIRRYIDDCEKLKNKYCNMYQELLRYREKYKLETMRVSLDYKTSHSVDDLPL